MKEINMAEQNSEEYNKFLEERSKQEKIFDEKAEIFNKKYLNKDGSINWIKIYCGDMSQESTGRHLTLGGSKEDEISFRIYNILSEEQIADAEKRIKEWLDKNDMQDRFELRYEFTDADGNEITAEKHGFKALSHFVLPWVAFRKYKIMIPNCSNCFDSYWIASSPSWPRVISSERIYEITDNKIDGIYKHNCLKNIIGNSEGNSDPENYFKNIEEIIGSEIK